MVQVDLDENQEMQKSDTYSYTITSSPGMLMKQITIDSRAYACEQSIITDKLNYQKKKAPLL